jgi:hypothetical protein
LFAFWVLSISSVIKLSINATFSLRTKEGSSLISERVLSAELSAAVLYSGGVEGTAGAAAQPHRASARQRARRRMTCFFMLVSIPFIVRRRAEIRHGN